MPGNQINITVGGQVAPSLGASTAAAANGLNGVGQAAAGAAASLQRLPPAVAPAGRGLGQIGRDAIGAASALNRIPPVSGPASRGLGAVGSSATQAAAGLNNLRPGTQGATYALTNLGRVAQDAPFGLIGIANNLEPLVASFISVRQQAGSAGGAFRALGASLLGPGGLILGIGLISTIATLAGQGLFTAKKATDEFRESLNKANEEAGKEIAQIRILATVAGDTTRSTVERTKAAKDLQSQLKDNNVALSQEAILNGQVASAINLATAAILERAKARAIESRIAELTSKNLERELQRPDLAKRRLETQKQLNAERAKETRIAGSPSTVNPVTQGLATAARDALIELDQATLDANEEINKLLKLVKDEDITPKFDTGKTKKDTDLLKQRIAALKELQSLTGLDQSQQVQLAQFEIQLAERDSIKAGFTAEELQQQIDGIIEKAFPVKTFEFKLDKVAIVPGTISILSNVDVAGSILPAGEIPSTAFDGVINAIRQSASTRLAILREQFAQSIRDTIVGGAVDGLTSVGDTLGQAIGGLFNGEGIGSALAAGGEALLKIIGGVLQDIGKQIIATSVLVQTLKKALASLFVNPAAALGVGIGLVALGGLLKSIKFNVPNKFADGVTGFSGGLALVGERGPEIVELPGGSNVIPNHALRASQEPIMVYGVIRGEDIYLSNNRASRRRGRM